MRLLSLADQLRRWGLKVVEVDGWEHRGRDFPAPPKVVVWHHTGTPQSRKGDYPTLATVRDGRTDLPGPLSQVGLGRDGTAYVIAAGVANHAGKGTWRGIEVGNGKSVGIEAESPGDGTWTDAQRQAYPRVAAALHDLLGTTAALSCAHRESARPLGRKVDPSGIDMDTARSQVAALLRAGPKPQSAALKAQPTPDPKPKETRRMDLFRMDSTATVYQAVGSHLEGITGAAFRARGLSQTDVQVRPPDDPIWKLEKR